MDKETDSGQPAFALDPARKRIRQAYPFLSPPKHKFSRRNYESASVWHFSCLAISSDKRLPVNRTGVNTYLYPYLGLFLNLPIECDELVAEPQVNR